MSNPLTEALTVAMTQGLDPMANMTKDYGTTYVRNAKLDVVEKKASVHENIEQKLAKARERNADQSVIGAFERLLAEVNSI